MVCVTHCVRATADAEGEDDAFETDDDCGQQLIAATLWCTHVGHAAADDDPASRAH